MMLDASAIGARGWIARALLVVALSLLAHALVLVVGRRALQFPPVGFGQGSLIEVSLQSAPPAPVAPAAPAEVKPKPRPAPRRAVKRPPPPPPAPVPEAAQTPPPPASIEPEPVVEAAPAETELAATPAEETPMPTLEPEAEPALPGAPITTEFDASGDALLAELQTPPLELAWLPVSARYLYQTTDTRFPAVTGTTTVQWRFEEDRSYSASLVTTVFGLTVLELSSKGQVQRYGLAPDRYTEKTVGRAEWATNFDWPARRVTFSARDVERELREGIQDRLSFQFQLMALGQRLLTRFRPGAAILMKVGAKTDVTLYRFVVIGTERVHTGAGDFDTVKLERPKSDDNRDSRIEVWLAPDAAWLPVKLRFTDRRDQVTENLLAEILIPAQ